jgi:hypothetical protein
MAFECPPHPEHPEVRCEIKTGNHPECTGWSTAHQDYVDWLNSDYVPSKKVRGQPKDQLREMAERVTPAPRVDDSAEAHREAMAGSERAANALTQDQKDYVIAAITSVARQHAEFTADDVYQELGDTVPASKGIAALFRQAAKQGVLRPTGKSVSSRRGCDTTRGLTVYSSLIKSASQPM